MDFAIFPLREAHGVILAHSVTLAGLAFKKGRRLSGADLQALAAAGCREVTGVRIDDGDLGEDRAAELVGEAVCGENVRPGRAATGRVNLFSVAAGLAMIDRRGLDVLNQRDEAVTVATIMPWQPVKPRQMVATIKIIPFAVARPVIDDCLAAAAGPLISVAPFVGRRVAMILTVLGGTKENVLNKTISSNRNRVEACGGHWLGDERCPHDAGLLAAALGRALAGGADLVMIAGASATVDRRDVVPSAIAAAGGAIDHFGMPVDPGNLTLLAHIGEVSVVGVPGCARSPKLNGLDWVLGRLMVGLSVTSRDIMAMGVGGLLTEMRDRPAPRSGRQRQDP